MAAPHLAEQVGRVLDGRYRVVAPIGTGASAAVYLADDTTLRRRVALKVLHAALASDRNFLKRFETEAHTAAALSHPNIMRVLDWGEGQDGPFLVLEYLGGGSLRNLLDQENRLSPEQATQIGIQAARALDYAHRRGLVHRDIKPGNLLFDDEGRLAIADFGLARALAEAAWTEPGGSILGTARYASPEQVRGMSLDGKADVYALGLVLYEAVTGTVPFSADTTIATLMGRLDTQLKAPEELGPLGAVVEQATHPDPEKRLTAAEMLRWLEEAVSWLPTPARLTLPGAFVIDIDKLTDSDPTMLPGSAESTQTVSVEARPLPQEPKAPRKSLFKRRNIDESPLPATAFQPKMRRRLPKLSIKRGLAAAALILLLLGTAGGAYAAYYFTGGERTVPELEGLTLDQAVLAAERADVKLDNDGEKFSETVPAGQTFEQSPAPGTEIYPRQSARISVSMGPAPRELPAFVGQTVDEARPVLTELGFGIVTEDRPDEQVAEGRILEQTPPGGLQAKGTEIKFVVSSGPAPRTVPNVRGDSREQAVAKISAEQLRVAVAESFSSSVPAGQVISSSPGTGSSVARNSTVSISISRGPDLVLIPSVAGQGITQASATLEAAGFAVVDVRGRLDRPVTNTSPATGTRAARGSSVSLYTG